MHSNRDIEETRMVTPKVIRHVPFAHGTASIVPVCAPVGRYGTGDSRFEISCPICHVEVFPAEGQPGAADFFGTRGVMAWLESELGPVTIDAEGAESTESGRTQAERMRRAMKTDLIQYGLTVA
jgi:hypothetical protein